MFFEDNRLRQRFFVPAGLVALCCSIMTRRFFGDAVPHAGFFEGLFLGLSFSLGVAGLVFAALARSHE